jgi:hypothetical protein
MTRQAGRQAGRQAEQQQQEFNGWLVGWQQHHTRQAGTWRCVCISCIYAHLLSWLATCKATIIQGRRLTSFRAHGMIIETQHKHWCLANPHLHKVHDLVRQHEGFNCVIGSPSVVICWQIGHTKPAKGMDKNIL